MGRYVRDTGGGEGFEKPDAGTYTARCYQVIDVGTQPTKFEEDKARPEFFIYFELCGTKTEKDPSMPLAIRGRYKQSLHEKAKLRKTLKSWRGREFTDEELARFDITNILGKPCLVNVVHNDKGYADIGGVIAMPKQQEAAPLINPQCGFFLDEPDWQVFDGLSDYLKRTILSSPEGRQAFEQAHGQQAPASDDPPPISDDDIPF